MRVYMAALSVGLCDVYILWIYMSVFLLDKKPLMLVFYQVTF